MRRTLLAPVVIWPTIARLFFSSPWNRAPTPSLFPARIPYSAEPVEYLRNVPEGCQVGVVPFNVARHSLIVFVPRLTSRDISSRSDIAFHPAVEEGRRSCGSPPKLRIRKCLL